MCSVLRCHIGGMSDHRNKRPRDPSQLAKRIVEIATGERPEEEVNEVRSKAGLSRAREH